MANKKHEIIGLMSGTSLDGLDLVSISFTPQDRGYSMRISAAETIAYSDSRQLQLQQAHQMSAESLALFDVELGRFFGQEIRAFCERHALEPAYVGSHGHTVFHQPQHGLTLQIGNPFHMAVESGLPIVAQFRNMDVALGGQGAPLVPIADELLYGQFEACLNLGGIANMSARTSDMSRVARDLCICNIALNALAQKVELKYDAGGAIASSGKIEVKLLHALTQDPFYTQNGPKSIGKEFYESNVAPLIEQSLSSIALADVMCTVVEYIAQIIGHALNDAQAHQCLVTGGGTYNTYLLSRIQHHTSCVISSGSNQDIEFKEAIAFALLAHLRMEGKINVLKSVTGSTMDHSAGVIYSAVPWL